MHFTYGIIVAAGYEMEITTLIYVLNLNNLSMIFSDSGRSGAQVFTRTGRASTGLKRVQSYSTSRTLFLGALQSSIFAQVSLRSTPTGSAKQR